MRRKTAGVLLAVLLLCLFASSGVRPPRLKDVRFNGLRLGAHLWPWMENRVMDSPIPYQYHGIGLGDDFFGRINVLEFSATWSVGVDGSWKAHSAKDERITCCGRKIETPVDVAALFGPGEAVEAVQDGEYTGITYSEGEYLLRLWTKDGNLLWIELRNTRTRPIDAANRPTSRLSEPLTEIVLFSLGSKLYFPLLMVLVLAAPISVAVFLVRCVRLSRAVATPAARRRMKRRTVLSGVLAGVLVTLLLLALVPLFLLMLAGDVPRAKL